MHSPPEDLPPHTLVSALATQWAVTATSLEYRPVGFGSHHWEVAGADGTRWFVTVDELDTRRHTRDESLDSAFARLRAGLATARDLFDHGRSFVVAPVPTTSGETLARLPNRFGVALYPFIDGRRFDWGGFDDPAHRDAMLDMVTTVHRTPVAVCGHAMVDDFTVPHRDELEAGLRGAGTADRGPYARPTAELLAGYAAPLRRLLDHYDTLAEEGRRQAHRRVVTHGEPHPGNTMHSPTAGWLLIDWDTALLAPPERDLWMLAGDGAGATVPLLPSMLELYRVRWDIADIAVEVSRFRRPHPGNADDDKSWDILRTLVTSLG